MSVDYEAKYKELKSYLIRSKKHEILDFEVHLCEHCNLNCRYCDHFSPIAEEAYTSIEDLDKDFSKLASLGAEYIGRIKLLGGEPLLHNQLLDIVKMTRHYFPYSYIEICTNGLLLKKQKELFWEVLHNYDIHILITKYPIKDLDFSDVLQTAEKSEVDIKFVNVEEKTMWMLPVDLTGTQNHMKNYYSCWRFNECVTLDHGKIFDCPRVAHIHHFNNYFGKHIPVTDKDYISLESVESLDEILEYLSKPIPFCRWCDYKHQVSGLQWGRSERSIKEWTL